MMGRIVGVAACAQLLVLGLIFAAYLSSLPEISWQALAGSSGLATSKESYQVTYLITGLATVLLANLPHFFQLISLLLMGSDKTHLLHS